MNLKKEMYLLATLSMLFLGCGGGNNNDDNGSTGEGDKPITENFKYDKISIAGSSITWGSGYLGEESYVSEVEKYFREDVADTVGAYDNLTANEIIDEPMSYGGKLHRYNKDDKITGTLKASQKIAMVYAVKNGIGNAVVEMIVDDKSLGEYTINSNSDILPVKRIADVSQEKNEDLSLVEFYQPFRENNSNAVKTWNLDENKAHTFKLIVKSGTLLLNFITNHMYYFQNAGVGGYSTTTLLRSSDGISTIQEIVDFKPDLFIYESATNDANTWQRETEGRASTNDWKLDGRITTFSLVDAEKKPKQIQLAESANVVAGDVIIMGTYAGNINSLAVGVVDSVSSGIITLKDNAPTNVTNRCTIKSIKAWEDNVNTIVARVKSANSKVTVGIGTSGVPNYWGPSDAAYESGYARRLMGYREKGKILANDNGWMFYDFFNEVKAVEPGVDTATKWSKGDNTHPNANGYPIFGRAVTKVLKAQ